MYYAKGVYDLIICVLQYLTWLWPVLKLSVSEQGCAAWNSFRINKSPLKWDIRGKQRKQVE
jgi:hypothetical protein